MQDHNLFQAICRTNRLDGEDKDFGYIVDYKELLEQVQDSIAVYNSDELDTDDDGEPNNIILKDCLTEGKTRLDNAREALHYLCEPVPQPREIEQYLHYFCGDTINDFNVLKDTEPLRISFYKSVATFTRAYAAIVHKLEAAGYMTSEITLLEQEIKSYNEIRSAIKNHSGEELDIKPYESDMRHLINTYIQADPVQKLGDMSSRSLVEVIIETGIHDAIAQKLNQQSQLSTKAISETIINNVRKTIIRDRLTDPRFYDEMSKLLDDLINQKRDDTASYEQFLRETEALVNRLATKQPEAGIPAVLHGNLEATVLFNNLATIPTATFQCPTDDNERATLSLELDRVMREQAPAGWNCGDDDPRAKQVRNALYPLMARDRIATQAIYDIIKNQSGY